jgi:MFS family permease
VIAGSAGVMLLGGLFNVAEPLFATNDLDAGGSGYSILVAAFGCGFVFGSLQGATSGDELVMKRRYLNGLVLNGVALIASGLSPSLWPAFAAFALAGFGNGVLLVHERLLIQATVPESLHGRVFAMSDTLVSWAFALAFVGASPILSVISARTLILAIGVVGLIAAIATALSLRGRWGVSARPAPPVGSPETGEPAVDSGSVPVGTLGADADPLRELGTR